MNTPAAKRRRVDAANATLRKPFHSPLLRRQPDACGSGTPGPSKTPDSNSNKRSLDEAYSPSSPSAAKRQPQEAKRPVNPCADGQKAVSANPLSSSRKSLGATVSSPKESKAAGSAGGGDDGNPFLALARAHQARRAAAGRDAIVRDLDRRLDLVRQAREIEDASERSRPGEPVDQELRDLVVKWRTAGRLAADELFETVKERVDNAGGPKAWKAMQQRQLDFYRGFDQGETAKSKDSDGEYDPEFSQDVQAHLEGAEEAEGKHDEDDELVSLSRRDHSACSPRLTYQQDFNMGHMLRSLKIDFSLLGYDEKEDKWVT